MIEHFQKIIVSRRNEGWGACDASVPGVSSYPMWRSKFFGFCELRRMGGIL